ncbi:NEP1-interacting protein [Arachis hypogaea]|nr:NEP1-interacting protein [Arachis hypogaea]
MEFVAENPSPLLGSFVERVNMVGSHALSAIVRNIFSAIFTFCFALVGTLLGAMTGALIGQETESGFIRGAAIGAISGAVFSIEVLNLLLFFGNLMNLELAASYTCLM